MPRLTSGPPEDGSSYARHLEDLYVLNAAFTAPVLDTSCQVDLLSLTAAGKRIEPDRPVLECRALEPDNRCHGGGQQGVPRGT